MAPITPAVRTVCRCKEKERLRRFPRGLPTRTRLSSLLRLNLDSSLKTTWFHSTAVCFLVRGTTPNGGVDWWVSRAAYVMGTAILNVLQPSAFVWFEKPQWLLVKQLPVPGWWLMKQLAVRGNFLRCGGVLDDWSVEGFLSLDFV
ncbi:e3 ubiquitin-protein ligase RNF13 [Trichonephila clavipes]|nr:e3 ubiquitin-protein ligase RNF13 [Trichonephila clavipes]